MPCISNIVLPLYTYQFWPQNTYFWPTTFDHVCTWNTQNTTSLTHFWSKPVSQSCYNLTSWPFWNTSKPKAYRKQGTCFRVYTYIHTYMHRSTFVIRAYDKHSVRSPKHDIETSPKHLQNQHLFSIIESLLLLPKHLVLTQNLRPDFRELLRKVSHKTLTYIQLHTYLHAFYL